MIFTSNPINWDFSSATGDTWLLLVPGHIWLPTSPIFTLFQTSKVPTLYRIMGYRQLLYCALEAHTHSPVRWTHFPLSNGTVGVRHRVNLTDWEFQSETFWMNEVGAEGFMSEAHSLNTHLLGLRLVFVIPRSFALLLPLELVLWLELCRALSW